MSYFLTQLRLVLEGNNSIQNYDLYVTETLKFSENNHLHSVRDFQNVKNLH